MDREMIEGYADAFAFVGNSLLSPMSQNSSAGLEAEFWDNFPDFGVRGVESAVFNCARRAAILREEFCDRAVTEVSVEFTHLFVGPPRPAVAPWETFYRVQGVCDTGFGNATFKMRRRLHEAGLELQNENNQYEDHMGIELLFLSVLCRRGVDSDEIRSYISHHPGFWIVRFRDAIVSNRPDGYFSTLVKLAEELVFALDKNLSD